MRDAVNRFKAKDRSAEALTGTEMIACGGRLCDAAEKTSSTARHAKPATNGASGSTPAATPTNPTERMPR